MAGLWLWAWMLAAAAPEEDVPRQPAAAGAAMFADLPKIDQLVAGIDQAAARETIDLLVKGYEGEGCKSGLYDQAYARAPENSRLKGYVAYARAGCLHDAARRDAARRDEAAIAVDEAIRLLPEYGAPLVMGTIIHSFADRPVKAADMLLKLITVNPDAALAIDRYYIGNITSRLDHVGDQARIRRVHQRLLEIGWGKEHPRLQSRMTVSVIEGHLMAGASDKARALLAGVTSPPHLHAMMIDRRYEALWADIERNAGQRLEKAWPGYLETARAEWRSKGDMESALGYAGTLSAAGHYDAILRDLLPLTEKPLDPAKDEDMLFIAGDIASALAERGRYDEIQSLYARLLRTWPTTHTNSLNLTGNAARYRFQAGDAAGGLADLDRAIAIARTRSEEVGEGALQTMAGYRGCMLAALGRTAEAEAELASLKTGAMVMRTRLLLCLGRREEARELMLDRLSRPSERQAVIGALQPSSAEELPDGMGGKVAAAFDAMRSDPELLRAAEQHGRILPFSLEETAPPEAR